MAELRSPTSTAKLSLHTGSIASMWMLTDRFFLVPLEKWTIHRWGLVWRPS